MTDIIWADAVGQAEAIRSGAVSASVVRNLGSGEPLATGTTLRASEQSIHHAPGRASAIHLPMPT